MVSDSILDFIRNVIQEESEALKGAATQVDAAYLRAIDLIQNSGGKVIVTGMGKSGHIARKIAATMCSTGTVAFYLNPADAQHGDLGIVAPKDVVIALSKSGESDELIMILPIFKKIGAKVIAITSESDSSLTQAADVVIRADIGREAGHLELAPTTSTTVALAIGDALAMALMKLKNFKEEDFALYHPGGSLGRQLSLSVEDLMIPLEKCPVLHPESSTFESVLALLDQTGLGLVLLSREKSHLDGILTDGDLRRHLSVFGPKIFEQKVVDLMNKKPLSLAKGTKAMEALKFMEERERPLNVIPITDASKLCGILRLHELLKLKRSPL